MALPSLALYAVTVLGELKLVLYLHVTLLMTAFVLALVAARRLGASSLSVFWPAAALIVLSQWSFQLRAQSFAFVLFVVLLWLLSAESRAPSKRVWLFVPILILWANLHGSVVLAAGLVVLAGLSYAVTQLRATQA